MRMEHQVRMIRDLEETGEVGVNHNLGDFMEELIWIDEDWEMQRDETRAATKSPLTNDEWGRLRNPTRMKRGGDGCN